MQQDEGFGGCFKAEACFFGGIVVACDDGVEGISGRVVEVDFVGQVAA